MKKLISLILCCLICGITSAQLIKQKVEKQKKQSELDWYNCSFDRDSVYGAEVNKAYEYLNANKKKLKKRPIVALIGTGMDVEHEDLRQAIWINPKEKLNQKDDDRNGLIDDINGWNFLGGKDAQVVESLTREGEREFFRLKDKYADYIFDGKKYYKIINGTRQEVAAPENMEEYNYYRYKVMPESRIGSTYSGLQLAYVIEEYVEKFNRDMKQRFPGKELTVEEFQSCYDPKAERDSLSEVALRKYGTDQRKEITGDNPMDINDSNYGNNILLTSDAATNIMKAGIIAAKRDNKIGSDGIADQAEIMTLRICTREGEPYLKDMALAIHYAVSHGADVIVLPEQNMLYPEEQKQWIIHELKEAEKKGAIVIVPAWNTSIDMDKVEFFPNRKMSKDKELTNLMIVASSDKKGNPVMDTNYGANTLDIYAPGTDIYSAYMGDTYRTGTGEGLAAATVAGVATLIKSYFPKLTGSQIRDILLKSVTSRKGVEVEKGIRVDDRPSQDLFLFDDLCISGGIVNAYQAILEAEKMNSQKK